MLPACQHDPAECDHVQFADRSADDRKGILPDLTLGGDVIRRFNVALVDLVFWNELINVDGPSALNLNRLKFLVFNNEVLAFRDFIPPRHVLPGYHLTGFGIHILLL